MLNPGQIISYLQMCQVESASLQKGMNYKLHGGMSVFLMSRKPNAPYADRTEDNGQTLIYEGHDAAQSKGGPDPKKMNQPQYLPSGKLTQNGIFHSAAINYKSGKRNPELIRVYEKLHSGVWVFNGIFWLIDSWQEDSAGRLVFKFKLEIVNDDSATSSQNQRIIDQTRVIPSAVKMEVWIRDGGRCVKCGKADNLHFDHIIPYSKGGSSLIASNIQLLCIRHNLQKHDKIE
jgi:hypothetical protein